MKENAVKAFVAVTLAGVSAYFRALLVPVIVLFAVMVIDYFSGMASAWAKNELSSRVGVVGIVKKVAYLLAVAVAIVADWIIQTAAGELGVDLGGFYFFGLLVVIWFILNECISILENVSELGVPIPAFLLKITNRLKKTIEETGESGAGENAPGLPTDTEKTDREE